MQNRKLVAISANSSWNIVNFRAGLVRALIDHGYQVTVLSPHDDSVSELATLGVGHHVIDMDPKGMSPIEGASTYRAYRRYFRDARPLAFLGFTPKPNAFGSMAAHAEKVLTINNMTGMAFVERAGLAKWLPILMLRLAFRRSRTVFFQNPDDLALFRQLDVVRANQAKLIPGSGIDVARFQPSLRYTPQADGFRFLLVARLLWEKGVREFVEAARQVRVRHPAARFQLLGFLDVRNPSAIGKADVDAWVAEGLIDYLGSTNDVRPHLAGADCLVLPSYREGLPRVLLEGGAMARPMIATDAPGCKAIITDRETGLLCQTRSAESLAAAMLAMIEMSSDQRAKYATAARRRVEEQFDEQLAVACYLEELGATSRGPA